MAPVLTPAARHAAAERLDRGARALGLAPSEQQKAQLLSYLELLLRWGETFNLTAIRDPLAMVDQHLLDSLSLVACMQRHGWQRGRLLDLGAGAGLPGIPLAILSPGLEVTLVDAVQKKTAFQIQAKGALGLSNCTPLHARVEALTYADGVDFCVARAFASLRELCRLAAPLLGREGRLLAMKGQTPEDELAELDGRWQTTVEPLEVPGLNARRCVVIVQAQDQIARDDAPSTKERVHG